MKATKLALKKLSIILQEVHEINELRFAATFLYPGLTFSLNNKSGLYIEDFYVFINRCNNFGIEIIGLEIHPDSEYPTFIFSYEQFMDTYNVSWIDEAINVLVLKNINKDIIPIINISKSLLDKYLMF